MVESNRKIANYLKISQRFVLGIKGIMRKEDNFRIMQKKRHMTAVMLCFNMITTRSILKKIKILVKFTDVSDYGMVTTKSRP